MIWLIWLLIVCLHTVLGVYIDNCYQKKNEIFNYTLISILHNIIFIVFGLSNLINEFI